MKRETKINAINNEIPGTVFPCIRCWFYTPNPFWECQCSYGDAYGSTTKCLFSNAIDYAEAKWLTDFSQLLNLRWDKSSDISLQSEECIDYVFSLLLMK